MNIICAGCESKPAVILCCDDNDALCAACDHRLARQHNRVPLQAPDTSQEPALCDICQEGTALIFCRDDRAMLCRTCDFSIHTATSLAEKHHRYFLPGVTVALHSLQDARADEASSSETAGVSMTGQQSVGGAVPHVREGGASGRNVNATSQDFHIVPTSTNADSQGQNPMEYHPTASNRPHTTNRDASAAKAKLDAKLAAANWRVDELLDIPGLADGYNPQDIDALADFGDFDFDFGTLLEVPSSPAPHGGHKVPHMEAMSGYSSDDGLGVVPDVDHKRRRYAM
ncbi:hypothetical protein CYMTET_22321 [Cymbomonas tetramitiformis]|uniref:B box-type domain-containing protein n=1 Tax=Cymbomonas tetramitiformis TaxID=36881 RepID=A0AAE0G0T5_9CHLO|nr:hypothetical protein CYMTET_22321 [Cymbomonas tetramitiformis]